MLVPHPTARRASPSNTLPQGLYSASTRCDNLPPSYHNSGLGIQNTFQCEIWESRLVTLVSDCIESIQNRWGLDCSTSCLSSWGVMKHTRHAASCLAQGFGVFICQTWLASDEPCQLVILPIAGHGTMRAPSALVCRSSNAIARLPPMISDLTCVICSAGVERAEMAMHELAWIQGTRIVDSSCKIDTGGRVGLRSNCFGGCRRVGGCCTGTCRATRLTNLQLRRGCCAGAACARRHLSTEAWE